MASSAAASGHSSASHRQALLPGEAEGGSGGIVGGAGGVGAGTGAFPTAVDLREVDQMVLEYLLYRGFTRSFRAMAADSRVDRIHAYEVERVVRHVFDLIHDYDLAGFHDLWNFLEARFFAHLDANHTKTVTDLRSRLDRYFLVHSIKTNRKEMVFNFFELMGAEIHARNSYSSRVNSWAEWFALPYLREPSKDPIFATYFTQQWLDQLRLSFSNFLSLIFRATPLPKLLLLEKWHRGDTQQMIRHDMRSQRDEIHRLSDDLVSTKSQLGALLESTRELISLVHHHSLESTRRLPTSGELFADEGTAEAHLRKLRDDGLEVIRLAGDCATHRSFTPGAAPAAPADLPVDRLVKSVNQWIQELKLDKHSRA